MERLNLTSAAASARIEREINERYRWVLSAVGMLTSSRGIVTADTVIGNRYVQFDLIQKLLSVFNEDGQTLGQVTFDELRNRQVLSDPPREYAIAAVEDDAVTIYLDCEPATVYTLSADVMLGLPELGDTDTPEFPTLFHDILVYGVKAIELRKMEKPDLADEAEAMFQSRLSELRYFNAKSIYLDIYQGRRVPRRFTTQLV
jgi:hypothetical protein